MNQNQNQNTEIYNVENFSLDYQGYKALIRPISDLISVLWDVTKNTNEYIEGYNNSEELLEQSIFGYCTETIENRKSLLYEILVDCVKSYNVYKQTPTQFNVESWGGEYPKLDIENINNETLRDKIESIIVFFSLCYHPDENRQRYLYVKEFQEAFYILSEILLNNPERVGLSEGILATVPNKIRNSVILDIVSYSMGSHNNNYNNYNNQNRNYNNQMNENQGNGLPNNNTHCNVKNYTNTSLNTSAVKQCFDPLLANEKNIIHEDAVLYILNKQNKIIRTICIDEDSYNGILVNDANIFYQCKPSVPQGSLYIPPDAVLPTRLRKIAIDIIIYVYENQAKQIQLGRKYVLIPTQEKVGRIASYATVRGNSVVSAEHCQNNYNNDYIYDIQEYTEPVTTVGGKRKIRKTYKKTYKKTRKARNNNGLSRIISYRPTKKNLKYLRRFKQGKSIGFTMRSSLKAKGLIPRSNGTYRVSAKYMKKVRR